MCPIDSRRVIMMLENFSEEINFHTLSVFLVANTSTVKRLKYDTSYWPRHRDWFHGARKALNEEISKEGTTEIRMLSGACCSSVQEITTLSDRFRALLVEVFGVYFDDDTERIRTSVVRILGELEAPKEDLEEIGRLQDIDSLTNFLIERMVDKGGPYKQSCLRRAKKERGPRGETFCTYAELKRKGLSAVDIARQCIANDFRLYGATGHEGKEKQLADHISQAETNWGFLCVGKNVVGNYSYYLLSDQLEEELRNGQLRGCQVTIEKARDPRFERGDDVSIYLMNMSVNPEYRESIDILWKHFGEQLQNLASRGTFYRTIYAAVFSDEHKRMYESMGFSFVAQRVHSGSFYGIDLTGGIPEKLSWIMPASEELYAEYWGKRISYQQLTNESGSKLSEQQLRDIAALVWDTDRFISQGLLASRGQAQRLLPVILRSGRDAMFSFENLFVAMASDRIIGILLFKRGPLQWSSKNIRIAAEFLEEAIPPTLGKVEKEYFACYDNVDEETVSILNFCVHYNWKSRGIKIGSKMMEAFLKEHPNAPMELHVLHTSREAISVYWKYGFVRKEQINGFSLDGRELPCDRMVRTPNKTEL